MTIKKILKWGFNYLRLFFLKLIYRNRLKLTLKKGMHPPYVSWRSKIGIAKTGKIILSAGTYVSPFVHVQALEGAMLIIGERSYIGDYSRLIAKDTIVIGNNCLLANNVSLYDHDHIYSDISRRIGDQGYKIGKIIIEDDCWLATNVVALKNTNISKHSVIGANSVVVGRLKVTGVYAGIPAKLKRVLNES